VIFIPEVKQVEPVAAHKLQPFRKPVYLIQVKVKHKNIVMKAVHFWRKAVMHYFGFVEAGIHVY